MRKVLFAFLLIFSYCLATNAQLEKEHTFEVPKKEYTPYWDDKDHLGNNNNHWMTSFSFISETYGLIYVIYNPVSLTINFYKEDYSLFRSTNIGPLAPDLNVLVPDLKDALPPCIVIQLVSEKLFDSDNSFELIISMSTWHCITTGTGWGCGYFDEVLILKDNGNVIKRFGDVYCELVYGCDTYKLFVQDYTTGNIDVYPLPGTLPACYGAKNSLRSTDGQADYYRIPAYPNPASTNITIPYALQSGEEVTLSVYSTNGMLKEQRTIKGTGYVRINTSRYPSGVYIYKYGEFSGQFIVR